MSGQHVSKTSSRLRLWQRAPLLQSAVRLATLFLAIELFDELYYGIHTAALPALRSDLGLSYAQVGLLLSLPGIVNALIEPGIMLLGDTRWRKWLVVGGGLAISIGSLTLAEAGSFTTALLAMVILFPASGAFVTLSQATLMDLNPGREAQMMARWTAAGSVGNLIGPLALAGGFALGWGWRWAFAAMAGVALVMAVGVVLSRFPGEHKQAGTEIQAAPLHARELLPNLWRAVRQPGILRWFFLLEMSDLLLDVYSSYLAIYLADVAGLTKAQTALALSGLMLVSLAADLALIPLLERVNGRKLVRAAALGACIVYPAMLLAPWAGVKVALALLVRLTTLGWYPVLQGEAYASLPGRSGTVMAIHSVIGVVSMSLIWLVGWTAEQAGLPAAMWLLLAGPLALVVFIPRGRQPGA